MNMLKLLSEDGALHQNALRRVADGVAFGIELKSRITYAVASLD